ncbi:MAG: NADH-quinone oxidoreductase subunit I [Cyclobacteriaceae bacterium]|nr:NADH-quinone oxidoreductase subunit I [Cyclobacteriaceae bacterium]
MDNKVSVWAQFAFGGKSLFKGLALTFSHLLKSRKSRSQISIQEEGYFDNQRGIATVQYPFESIPVPDNGRYKLHNEIEDCIVCDKCVKVCPVNCITIEPIRSPEEFGKTSDGTPKRIYAAKFDIDMGKCCFCGLCTTVCPTECLTMTKEYDFSTFDIPDHNFSFGNMTPQEIEEKKKAWDEHPKNKMAVAPGKSDPTDQASAAKPVFKPRIKPPTQP